MIKNPTTRRHFLKTMSATSALVSAPAFLAAQPEQHQHPTPRPISANDRIGIGVIGMGIIASYKVPTALEVPGVELVAVADCYDGRLTRTHEVFGSDVFTTRNYQEVLARADVDAVLICTPDHWHAQIAVEAMKAGKDVFVEKPMVQRPEDGHKIIQAQKETGKVVQVGSQSFRSPVNRKAKELLQAGVIGELNMVESVVSRNNGMGAWQYTIPPDASPDTIDWKGFVGPAPMRAFDADRFFRWRKYWDYGTGVAGDMFVHRFSALHFMLDAIGPTRAMSTGGVFYWNDNREAPDVINSLYDYPETASHPAFTLVLKANFADGSGGGPSFRFIGNEGVMEIQGNTVSVKNRPSRPSTEEGLVQGYNSVRTFSQAQQDAFVEEYRQYHSNRPQYDAFGFGGSVEYTAPQGHDSNLEHFSNFFDAVRNKGEVVQDAVFGLRAAGPAVLSNHSYKTRKPIEWDPEGMRVL